MLHPATENRPDTFTQVNGKTHVPGVFQKLRLFLCELSGSGWSGVVDVVWIYWALLLGNVLEWPLGRSWRWDRLGSAGGSSVSS